MFKELTEELLDLTATEKGYGNAMYAVIDGDLCSCCSCSCCCFSW